MVYVCEYDDSTDSRILLEAAGCFFQNRNILDISQSDISRMDTSKVWWTKLRERIMAWILLEYALKTEWDLWVSTVAENDTVDKTDRKKQVYERTVDENSFRGYVERIGIARTEYGKPYSSRYPQLYFNLSHCACACACVLSDVPAGIDIERKFPYKENMQRHICCGAEGQRLDKLQFPQKEMQLQYLWSVKEAFVKMNGRGLGYGMKNINLAEFLPMMADDFIYGNDDVSFAVKSGNAYTLAVCGKKHDVCKNVTVLKEKELSEWIKKGRKV